jgi:Family of unknown function (DUF6496)
MAATRRARSRKTTRKTSRKYGKAADKTVASAMRRHKRGTLRSSSGAKVKSRKQAVAIGISEARAKGAKVPARPKSSSRRRSTSRSRSASR